MDLQETKQRHLKKSQSSIQDQHQCQWDEQERAAGGNNEKILPFTESSDGKTFSVTLPNGGRFRIHPYIPAFDNLNPSFGAWKREYAVNPETLEIYLRKEGMDEPNKDYVWAANTIITLDFRAAKGTIVVP